MKILAVGAHVDDIELACGGTMARAAAAGATIQMLVLTHSAYERYDGTVLRTPGQALEEAEAAAKILGIQTWDVLSFDTKDVPFDSRVVEAIERRLDALRPDLVFTHWPNDTHQAHRAVGRATIAAARWYRSILMYEPMMPDGRSHEAFRPQVYVDTSAWAKTKARALMAHRSQFAKYGSRWVAAVSARGALRGFEMGVEAAEAFEAVRLELTL